VEAGISRGLKSIGFSSHAPLPFSRAWAMDWKDLKAYCQEVEGLKGDYRNEIQIFLGLEVDYLPGLRRFGDFRTLGVDYLIGSNHFMGRTRAGDLKRVESVEAPLIIGDDIQGVVANYYRGIRDMIKTEGPDILGHMDLIKKLNGHKAYFNGGEGWYLEEVDRTLDALRASSTILEVNTSGPMTQGDQGLYPSLEIIKRAYRRGIPITLGSDAHRPEDIDRGYDQALDLLRGIGFKAVMAPGLEGWTQRKI